MQPQPTAVPLTVSRGGVLVVSGFVTLRVDRSHLVVADGYGRHRRESRFARPTSGIRRFVVVSRSGYLSLAGLEWLAGVGASFIHLDPDGRLLATSAGFGLDDARLRTLQGRAFGTASGLAIARDLLRLKFDGQARVAHNLPNGAQAVTTIGRLRPALDAVGSPKELMVIEAAAANAYWQAWADISIPWVRADVPHVPHHWLTVGPRTSPLSGSPRLPIAPAHSVLGYLTAVAAAEARLACLAVGLDPGLGVLHAPQRARDSLALDVLEGIRADLEAHLLGLLRGSVFRADDFHETRQGVCRVLQPLSHRLAETGPQWAKLLAPVVERVSQAFADSPDSRITRLPTKLTQAHRSAGRDELRRQPRRAEGTRLPRLDRSICRGCGVELSAGHSWCDSCRPDVKLQAGLDGLAAARAVRAELRLRGHDPAASDAAKAKLRETLRRRRAEESVWDRDHPQVFDPTLFGHDVLPLIQEVPVRRLAAMTGLSVGYCALVRRGLRTPHRRWWELLANASNRE